MRMATFEAMKEANPDLDIQQIPKTDRQLKMGLPFRYTIKNRRGQVLADGIDWMHVKTFIVAYRIGLSASR